MMMSSNNLPHDVEAKRWKIAIGVALLIMVAVVALWVISLSGRFANAREKIPKEARPFQAIKNSFKETFSDVKYMKK